MISQQKINRLERLVHLLGERAPRYMLESRKQTAALGNYVTAVAECDAARQSLRSKPDDLETRTSFHRAKKTLEIARGELKLQTATQRRRLSG